MVAYHWITVYFEPEFAVQAFIGGGPLKSQDVVASKPVGWLPWRVPLGGQTGYRADSAAMSAWHDSSRGHAPHSKAPRFCLQVV